jgi:monolysocardiolipin acyltransferase
VIDSQQQPSGRSIEAAQAPPKADKVMGRDVRKALARFKPRPTWGKLMYSRFIGLVSRLIMERANTTVFTRGERLQQALDRGRGLLTFSNHVSLYDDPWITACLYRKIDWVQLRWVASDALNFFGTPLKGLLFSAGKCVPIVRGAGPDQLGMKFLAERLRLGDWVHVFPEGGRSREPEGRLRSPLKSGLAHLVEASRPLLLPFYHRGMQQVLPVGARLPGWRKRVQVVFGEVTDSAEGSFAAGREQITAWVEAQLRALEDEVDAGPLAGA